MQRTQKRLTAKCREPSIYAWSGQRESNPPLKLGKLILRKEVNAMEPIVRVLLEAGVSILVSILSEED